MIGSARKIVDWLMQEIREHPDKVYECIEKKNKRSLDSNSYFHVLCDKLRQKLGMSMARCKNHLIADYGQIEYQEDGSALTYTTKAPPEYMQEQEYLHTALISIKEVKGITWYSYRIYRGSHTYNSAEMTKLIAGTVEECKEQGIETLTPRELDEMNIRWGKKHG